MRSQGENIPGRAVLARRFRPAGALFAALSCAAAAHGQGGFVNWETAHVTPLALTPSGNTLLAVNTADGRVEVFDVSGASAASPKWKRSISVGLDPVSVRVRSETEAWVVNQISDTVSIIDLPTGRITRTLFPGDEPADVAFAGSLPTRAFVSVSGLNQVRVYDTSNPGAAPTIVPIAGWDPRAIAVSPDGSKVYVAIFGSGNETTIVKQQDVSNPAGPYGGVNPPPNSGTLFSPPKAANLPVPPAVAQIVRRNEAGQWMDDNNRNWSQFVTWNLADNDVAIIDASTLAVTYAKGMLSTVMALAVKQDGTVTTVGLDARNEVRFEPNVQGRFVRVSMGCFQPSTPASKVLADMNPHLTYSVPSLPQAFRDLSIGDPRGVVWHPMTGRAYVSGMGSNNVIVTDSTGTRYSEINVGKGPTGLALSPDGARVYALNKFDGSVSAISTASNTETARVAFMDPTPSVIKLGRPLLYDTHRTSGLGQASCASCHIDGRSDFLAWDLGDPSGAMKSVNFACFGNNFCQPWHPMKGPMVSQTLQGIVGTEPLHWRGDRENVAAFAPAYTGLQAMDAQPSAAEMTAFTNFIATIKYPPNPNRTIFNAMPPTMPTFGNTTGSPTTGASLFQSFPIIGPFTCATCHTLTTGTTGAIDDALASGNKQSMKMAQLRGITRKPTFDKASQQSIRGFGFNHDSEFDSLNALLSGEGFNFTTGAAGEQQKRDIEAFLLCFPGDTLPSIGQQVTFDGTNNTDPAATGKLDALISLAGGNSIGVIAKGRRLGQTRGWYYYAGNIMQADRHNEQISVADLKNGAAPGAEITFTAVPSGQQLRMGVDRDLDNWYDFEEISACADPGNAANFPGSRGALDVDANLAVNVQDIFAFLNIWFAGDPRSNFNGTGGTDVQDIFDFLNAWLAPC